MAQLIAVSRPERERWLTSRPNRSRRVIILLIGIVILSIADLFITLTHLRGVGMIEANPIAAYLIQNTRSPWILSAYKLLTVAICVALLYRVRQHALGETASWLSVLILAGMSLVWHTYSLQLEEPEKLQLVLSGTYSDEWMFLD